MSPPESLETRLREVWPPASWADVTVLLAVSGGADSVAMARAMARLKAEGPGRLVVAHVNHGLRADESQEDQRFVEALCRQLGLPCAVECLDPGQLDRQRGNSFEAAARSARYERLRATAERLGARYAVTAHTADDQAETILHRILRGTGLTGLAGIPRARPLGPAVTLIRPMLGWRRSELVAYLTAIDQPYRQDSTNWNLQITRNAIRHQLLPQLAERYNTNVVDALVRLGRLAGEAREVIDQLVVDLANRCVAPGRAGSTVICGAQLTGQPHYLVREVVMAAWRAREWPRQAMGFAEWQALAEMLAGDPAKQPARTLPAGIRAERQGDRLLLWPAGDRENAKTG